MDIPEQLQVSGEAEPYTYVSLISMHYLSHLDNLSLSLVIFIFI